MTKTGAALCALVAAVSVASCAAKTNDGISAPASTWLTAEITAARTAAAQGNYRDALTDLGAIEASVRSFRSQHAIDGDRADRILAAVLRVRTALGPHATTTTVTTAPPPTTPPPRGRHGHKQQGGDDNGD
jgi:hypothetical protein